MMRSSQGGFTLIEVMVTLAIAAILMAVAAPALLSSIGSRQAQSIGSTFVQDAAWARSKAIAGQSAQITLMPDCSWSVSVAGESSDVLSAHAMTSAQIASSAPGLTCSGVPSAGLVLAFDSMGLVTLPAGQTTPAPTIVGFVSSHGGAWSSTVEIFGSGTMLWEPQNAS